MLTNPKIRINDVTILRQQLDALYQKKSQVELAYWALRLAEHIFALIDYDFEANPVIQNGFEINKNWQEGAARIHDVRQAGFLIHRLAKECGDSQVQAALRVAGHAVSTAHMREHAMVASDYAIKVINLRYPDSIEAIENERVWQIAALQSAGLASSGQE